MSLADAVERQWPALLCPPPLLRLSDYAEQYYKLSAESSAEVGDWRCIPYQRGILANGPECG